MKMKKIVALLMTAILLVASFGSVTASAFDFSDLLAVSNANCTGYFESITYGQIVFYPADLETGEETYPVIVWANGTLCPPVLYYNLLSEIASNGYIVVANTEMMAADGTAQIESLDFILGKNAEEGDMFYQKIDTENIGAAGHSQGGRSSVNAAAADERFDCVLSLAGSNYVEEAELLSTPTFFVAGQYDFIVRPSSWIVPAYEACTGKAVYATLKGAIHTTCCFNPKAYTGYAVEWFDAFLKADTEAMATFAEGGTLSTDSDWQDFACKNF